MKKKVFELFGWIALVVALMFFGQNLMAYFSEQVSDFSIPLILVTVFIMGCVYFLIGSRLYTIFSALIKKDF